jgi:hypothetical protein
MNGATKMLLRVRRWLLEPALHAIHRSENALMTSAQDHANQLAGRIDTATTNIRGDIADLKAAHPEVDFSALEASVGGLEGLDAENPGAPADPNA